MKTNTCIFKLTKTCTPFWFHIPFKALKIKINHRVQAAT